MSQRSFFLQLFGITLLFAIVAIICSQIPAVSAYTGIFWLSIAFFFFFSLAMYFFAKKAALSSNRHAFTNVTIGTLAGKLLLSVVLLVIYKQVADPPDRLFIIPFFIVYLFYTMFETNFMIKLGRLSGNQTKTK